MKQDEKLTELHEVLATILLDRIRDPEVKSADLNVARQFLKDNDITAIPTDDNALAQLLQDLPFKDDLTAIQQ
tara:strand:+ start:283 stop:501 length:219 start_codon:yes stop_codon:yes gene_type:complete